MERQYSELPSWQKTRVSDDILDQISRNVVFHYKALEKFTIEANPKLVKLMPCTGSGFLTAVPEECQKEVLLLWNIYKQSESDLCVMRWYISKLLLHASSISVIKNCIPEYYWKYLKRLNLTGTATEGDLYEQTCYDILEQAQINNLLLGITNS